MFAKVLLGTILLISPFINECRPVENSNDTNDNNISLPLTIVTAVAVTVCFVFVVAMCACCQDVLFSAKPETSPQSLRHSNSMEPPGQSVPGTPRFGDDDRVTIEPLPDITVKRSSGNKYGKPMDYNHAVNKGLMVDDWFHGDHMADFPRNQLSYVKELGYGWFGHVVEGEATKIVVNPKKSKVFVKILREDLSSVERAFALVEARKHRDLKHENIATLLGKSFEKQPYLLIYEFCPKGDLKQYLIKSRSHSQELIQNGILMRICSNVASAVSYCHQNDFLLNDLACRNFFVAADDSVKLGDCEVAMDLYKDDYAVVGDIAVPIRWTAPDSIDVTDSGQIVTKELTKAANVWSFGVAFWEILEFSKKPYIDLTNDDVIEHVIRRRSTVLPEPLSPVPLREKCYQTMKMCWKSPPESRPTMANVLEMVQYINNNQQKTDDFESKWNNLLPAEKLSANLQYDLDDASPVPADPMIVRLTSPQDAAVQYDSSPANQIKIDQQTPVKAARKQKIDHTVVEMPAAVERVTVEMSQPANRDAELERIDKRNFVLTLNDDELATLGSSELVQFYEYLSKNEIHDLERRHTKAIDDSQARVKARETFLSLSLDEMDTLSSEELQNYLNLLDEKVKIDIDQKLSINREKRRLFSLDSQAMTSLDEDTVRQACESLSPADAVIFRQRVENARAEKIGRQNALSMMNSSDIDLSINENRSDLMKYLTEGESISVNNRLNDFQSKRQSFLMITDDELARMTEENFENLLRSLTYRDETQSIRDRRSIVINNVRKRDQILAADDRQLYLLSKIDLKNQLSMLNDDERQSITIRLEKFCKIREDILSGNADNYDDHAINDYLEQEEIDKMSIYNRKRKLFASDGLEFIGELDKNSDQLQHILTTDEKLIVASKIDEINRFRDRFLNRSIDFYENLSNDEELLKHRNYFTIDEFELISSKIREVYVKREKIRQQVLSADHLDLYLLSVEGLDPYLNYLDEQEALAVSHRLDEIIDTRKNLMNENQLVDEEILSEYFTDQEICDLKNRRHQKSIDDHQKSIDDQLSLQKSINDLAILNEISNAKGLQLKYLWEKNRNELESILSPDQSIEIRRKIHEIEEIHRNLLSANDRQLSEIDELEFDSIRDSLTPEEFDDLSRRRLAFIDNRSKILNILNTDDDLSIFSWFKSNSQIASEYLTDDQFEIFRNKSANIDEHRNVILNTTPTELTKMKSIDLNEYRSILNSDEYENLSIMRREALEAREGVLSLTDGQLRALTRPQLERYYKFLTEHEIAELENRYSTEEPSAKILTYESEQLPSLISGDPIIEFPSDDEMVTVIHPVDAVDETVDKADSEVPLSDKFLFEDEFGELENRPYSMEEVAASILPYGSDNLHPMEFDIRIDYPASDELVTRVEMSHSVNAVDMTEHKPDSDEAQPAVTQPQPRILTDEEEFGQLQTPYLFEEDVPAKILPYHLADNLYPTEFHLPPVASDMVTALETFHPVTPVDEPAAKMDSDPLLANKFSPADEFGDMQMRHSTEEIPAKILPYESDNLLPEAKSDSDFGFGFDESKFHPFKNVQDEESQGVIATSTPDDDDDHLKKFKLPRRLERLSLSQDVDKVPPSATAKDMEEFNASRQMALDVTDEALSKMAAEDIESFYQFLSPEESLKLQERKRKVDSGREELSTTFFLNSVPPVGSSMDTGRSDSQATPATGDGTGYIYDDDIYSGESPAVVKLVKMTDGNLDESEKLPESFLMGDELNFSESEFGGGRYETYTVPMSEDESVGHFGLNDQNLPEFRDYLKMGGPTLSMLSSSVDQSSEDERAKHHGSLFESESEMPLRNDQILQDFDSLARDSQVPTVAGIIFESESERNDQNLLDFDSSIRDSRARDSQTPKNLSLASELDDLFGSGSLAAPEINLILPTPSGDRPLVSPVWPLTRDPEGLVQFDYSTPIADSKPADLSAASAYVSALDDPFFEKEEIISDSQEFQSKKL